MGHIELSFGNLDQAEHYFESALRHCDPGSPNSVGILDSLAQIRLQQNDLDGCEAIVDRLAQTVSLSVDSNHSNTWALQTKVQLLLKRGRLAEAFELATEIDQLTQHISQPRLRTALQLLVAETLVARQDFREAAVRLGRIISASDELPPDLFAETERVVAKALLHSGARAKADVHFQRAIQTFESIGHTVGKQTVLHDFQETGEEDRSPSVSVSAMTFLDRLRALRTLDGDPSFLDERP